LTQRPPDECCFIDDRPENLEPAQRLGMHSIRMQRVSQLREELNKLGVQDA
jgi:FMN phosphatase YigB (HAD superfamily)